MKSWLWFAKLKELVQLPSEASAQARPRIKVVNDFSLKSIWDLRASGDSGYAQ